MITLQNVTLRRGPHILLQDINWTIFHKQRIGVIGENGSGKSSLFALLLQEIDADKGDLDIPQKLRLAHVEQETPAIHQPAIEFVLDGDTELRQLQQALLAAEKKDDGNQIAILYDQLGQIDGYTAPSRAARLLSGLGFHHSEHQKNVSSFSGGWRVRLNLAKTLMRRSDVLLLDEPTNHLDLDAVLWLEQWLSQYPGTLLLISHDRAFLDNSVDHIAHLSHQQLKLYAGNYSSFEKQRAEALLLQQGHYEKQQKQIAHMQALVNRFRAGTKSRQAQSRLKAIQRMDLLTAVQQDSPFQFQFKKPSTCPNPLLSLDDASVAYDNHVILKNLNMSITPKDRIAILGPNGAGKSSLIKLLAAEILPAQGVREASSGLKIGYFAQHQVEYLNLNESPLYHLRELAQNNSEQVLRTFLGTFSFTGNRVLEPIKIFSGGEKSRLALALIIWQQPNLLLLDEPTNHLDLEMRHALSLALQQYEGAMLLVSHDRFLVRTTTDQLMLVANGQLEEFTGDLNDYEKWLLEYRRQYDPVSETNKDQKQSRKNNKIKSSQQLIKNLENQIQQLEKQLIKTELLLVDKVLYEPQNNEKLQHALTLLTNIKEQLKIKENEWLALSDNNTGQL